MRFLIFSVRAFLMGICIFTAKTRAAIVTNHSFTVTTNTVMPTFGTIDPVGAALTDRFSVADNLHGFMFADQEQNWGPALFYSTRRPGSGADQFETISTIAPSAGAVTDRFGLSSTNYDALTLAAPDVGYGAVNFYYVRHDPSGVTTFGVIKPAGASSSADLWTIPGTGYNALAFAAADLGYGANLFYCLRQDTNGLATFGTIDPTPGGIATDRYAVGTNFDSLVFVPGAVSIWGTGIFAYLRHDATGSTIGTIDPVTHLVTDRMGLGTNFLDALTFTATDAGYGLSLFYFLRPWRTTLTTNTIEILTENLLASSANPSLTGSNVIFTTTWTAVSPGSGTPSGTVQFRANGAALGAPITLSSGVASLTTALLPHGSNLVTAEYAGDGTFTAYTNTLSPNQIVNQPPVPGAFALGLNRNSSASFTTTKLAKCSTDDDLDALSISAVNSSSAQGGSISLSGSNITYTAPADYVGGDSFTYTVSDSFSAATGTITVTVRPGGLSSLITSLTLQPDGGMQLIASGSPGQAYFIQACTNLSLLGPWTTIGSNAALTNGLVLYFDEEAPNFPSRFYRLAAP